MSVEKRTLRLSLALQHYMKDLWKVSQIILLGTWSIELCRLFVVEFGVGFHVHVVSPSCRCNGGRRADTTSIVSLAIQYLSLYAHCDTSAVSW